MRWPFRKKAEAPKPADINIPGIYTVCDRLGIGKTWRPEYVGKPMIVAMASGRDAIFRYETSRHASSTDWDFHIFKFDRYLGDGEAFDAPRYV